MKIFETKPFWYADLHFGAILAGFALSLFGVVIITAAMTTTVFALHPELMDLSDDAIQSYFNQGPLEFTFLSLGALAIMTGGALTAWLAKGSERSNVRSLMALWTYINAMLLPFWWDSAWWGILAGLFGPAAFAWIGAVPVEALRGKSIRP